MSGVPAAGHQCGLPAASTATSPNWRRAGWQHTPAEAAICACGLTAARGDGLAERTFELPCCRSKSSWPVPWAARLRRRGPHQPGAPCSVCGMARCSKPRACSPKVSGGARNSVYGGQFVAVRITHVGGEIRVVGATSGPRGRRAPARQNESAAQHPNSGTHHHGAVGLAWPQPGVGATAAPARVRRLFITSPADPALQLGRPCVAALSPAARAPYHRSAPRAQGQRSGETYWR